MAPAEEPSDCDTQMNVIKSSSTLFPPPGRRRAEVRVNYLLADCTLRKGQHQKDCGNIEAFTQELTHSSSCLFSFILCVSPTFPPRVMGAVDWKWVTLVIFVLKWEPVERRQAQILSNALVYSGFITTRQTVFKSF